MVGRQDGLRSIVVLSFDLGGCEIVKEYPMAHSRSLIPSLKDLGSLPGSEPCIPCSLHSSLDKLPTHFILCACRVVRREFRRLRRS